jgi:hypothetical protein
MCDHAGSIGPALKVAFTFGFFGMLRQSNLATASVCQFDKSRHTTHGDVSLQAPGVVIRIKWSKTVQTMDNQQLLPLPAVPNSVADPVAAYKQLLLAVPTTSARQPLLSYVSCSGVAIVTTYMLATSLRDFLAILQYDTGLYSLHSLRRGGATVAVKQGVGQLDIKRHGNWSSDTFWQYVTSPFVAQSPVAAALGSAVAATSLS